MLFITGDCICDDELELSIFCTLNVSVILVELVDYNAYSNVCLFLWLIIYPAFLMGVDWIFFFGKLNVSSSPIRKPRPLRRTHDDRPRFEDVSSL